MVLGSQVRPSNGNGGGIQILWSRGGYSMNLPKRKALPGGRQTGVFTVTAFSSQVGVYTYPSTFGLTISPAAVTSATKSVKISGTLTSFGSEQDCLATISFTGKLRRQLPPRQVNPPA
jgi:hypothetical protein